MKYIALSLLLLNVLYFSYQTFVRSSEQTSRNINQVEQNVAPINLVSEFLKDDRHIQVEEVLSEARARKRAAEERARF